MRKSLLARLDVDAGQVFLTGIMSVGGFRSSWVPYYGLLVSDCVNSRHMLPSLDAKCSHARDAGQAHRLKQIGS